MSNWKLSDINFEDAFGEQAPPSKIDHRRAQQKWIYHGPTNRLIMWDKNDYPKMNGQTPPAYNHVPQARRNGIDPKELWSPDSFAGYVEMKGNPYTSRPTKEPYLWDSFGHESVPPEISQQIVDLAKQRLADPTLKTSAYQDEQGDWQYDDEIEPPPAGEWAPARERYPQWTRQQPSRPVQGPPPGTFNWLDRQKPGEIHSLGGDCINPKCQHSWTPEEQHELANYGEITCPSCGKQQNNIGQLGGAPSKEEYQKAQIQNNPVRAGITLKAMGDIGEAVIQRVGQLPIGPITKDMNAEQPKAPVDFIAGYPGKEYGVEVKANHSEAQPRFKVSGSPAKRQRKIEFCHTHGLRQGFCGVRLNFYTDKADVFWREGFTDTWYGDTQMQHVGTYDFGDLNPFRQEDGSHHVPAAESMPDQAVEGDMLKVASQEPAGACLSPSQPLQVLSPAEYREAARTPHSAASPDWKKKYDYRKVNLPQANHHCGSCGAFKKGRCAMFDADVENDHTCDEWVTTDEWRVEQDKKVADEAINKEASQLDFDDPYGQTSRPVNYKWWNHPEHGFHIWPTQSDPRYMPAEDVWNEYPDEASGDKFSDSNVMLYGAPHHFEMARQHGHDEYQMRKDPNWTLGTASYHPPRNSLIVSGALLNKTMDVDEPMRQQVAQALQEKHPGATLMPAIPPEDKWLAWDWEDHTAAAKTAGGGEWDWGGTLNTMYHVVPSDDAHKVQSQGIDYRNRDKSRDWRDDDDHEFYPEANYLSTDVNKAADYARQSGGVVYKVDASGLPLEPDLDDDWAGTSFYTRKPIHPSRVLGPVELDHEWRPIAKTAAGQVMYHVAPRRLRETIQQQGLVHPSGRYEYDPDRDEYPPGVYLWPELEHAQDHADGKADVWQVDASGLPIERDPWIGGIVDMTDAELPYADQAMLVRQPVPPERLRRVSNQGQVMYHVAPRHSRDSILREGFARGTMLCPAPGVYLAMFNETRPEEAPFDQFAVNVEGIAMREDDMEDFTILEPIPPDRIQLQNDPRYGSTHDNRDILGSHEADDGTEVLDWYESSVHGVQSGATARVPGQAPVSLTHDKTSMKLGDWKEDEHPRGPSGKFVVKEDQHKVAAYDTKGKLIGHWERCRHCGTAFGRPASHKGRLHCPTCGEDVDRRLRRVQHVAASPYDNLALSMGWQQGRVARGTGHQMYEWQDPQGVNHAVTGYGSHGQDRPDNARNLKKMMTACMNGQCLHGFGGKASLPPEIEQQAEPGTALLKAGQQVSYGGKNWWVIDVDGGLAHIYDAKGQEDIVPTQQLRAAGWKQSDFDFDDIFGEPDDDGNRHFKYLWPDENTGDERSQDNPIAWPVDGFDGEPWHSHMLLKTFGSPNVSGYHHGQARLQPNGVMDDYTGNPIPPEEESYLREEFGLSRSSPGSSSAPSSDPART